MMLQDHHTNNLRSVKRRRFVFSCLLAVGVLATLELTLQGVAIAFPQIGKLLGASIATEGHPSTVQDDLLGHRPKPLYRDHDERGYRNRKALNKADIVCLGDSQTYGKGVECEEAWPHQLSLETGRSVYNISFGGWGPTQSEVLIDQTVLLQPKLVIVGFYSGNDLYDCYHMTYFRKSTKYRTPDSTLAEQLNALDKHQTIAELAKINILRIKQLNHYPGAAPPATELFGWNFMDVRKTLSQHCRLYGLARGIKNISSISPTSPANNSLTTDQQWRRLLDKAAHSGGKWEVVQTDTTRTILTPEFRLVGVNMSDPRIAEGHRIALASLMEIQRKLKQQRIAYVVALIPSKELVFHPWLDAPSKTMSAVVEYEARMWKQTKHLLTDKAVAHIDLLPALRQAVKDGQQPYPIGVDDHPNALGHAAISRALYERINADAK